MTTERTRTITWQDPSLTMRGGMGRTGLDVLRAIMKGELPPAPVQATLGFDLVTAEDGIAQFRCVPGEHLYNPMGSVHGGVAATLLDSAMGCAVMSVLDEKTGYTTLDFHVGLLRTITLRTGPIVAEGRILHRGSRMATAEGRLTDEAGRLLAHATTRCLLIERVPSA